MEEDSVQVTIKQKLRWKASNWKESRCGVTNQEKFWWLNLVHMPEETLLYEYFQLVVSLLQAWTRSLYTEVIQHYVGWNKFLEFSKSRCDRKSNTMWLFGLELQTVSTRSGKGDFLKLHPGTTIQFSEKANHRKSSILIRNISLSSKN